MSNLLDKFQKSSVGSRGKISDYLGRISPHGDFARVTDIEVVLTNWNNILLTPKRTYDHDPNFGSNLYKHIFEPADDQTRENIIDDLKDDLLTYDDRAEIESINVTFLENKKGFNVNIFVKYENQSGQVTATIDESVYFNFNK